MYLSFDFHLFYGLHFLGFNIHRLSTELYVNHELSRSFIDIIKKGEWRHPVCLLLTIIFICCASGSIMNYVFHCNTFVTLEKIVLN